MDESFFRNARPAQEVMPPALYEALIRHRGAGRKPAKAQVTIRLDRDVLEGFRPQGPGWQTRVNEILRKALG